MHSTTAIGGNSMWGANNGTYNNWNTVDIDSWLYYKRNVLGLTVVEEYRRNPDNE